MKEKSQQGIALTWIIIAGAVLITSVGVVVSRKEAPKVEGPQAAKDIGKDIQEMINQQTSQYEKNLLKILPPKERAELESAIKETQQVLLKIEVFDYAPPSVDDITRGLNQINRQTQEQIQRNIEKQKQEKDPAFQY